MPEYAQFLQLIQAKEIKNIKTTFQDGKEVAVAGGRTKSQELRKIRMRWTNCRKETELDRFDPG